MAILLLVQCSTVENLEKRSIITKHDRMVKRLPLVKTGGDSMDRSSVSPRSVHVYGVCTLVHAEEEVCSGGRRRRMCCQFRNKAENKCLDDHLFNHTYPSLEWSTRLEIVLGAAEGLVYLHGLEVQIIYRDFKASNVLLDKDFRPKLSDFKLAREGPLAGDTHVSTAVMGTCGYAGPDYIETCHLTDKSDVWSFGVVLYEILTALQSGWGPIRHLLQSGWGWFASVKKLKVGDTFIVLRGENCEFRVGVRRAMTQHTDISSFGISSQNMHLGVLASAWQAVITDTEFKVIYNPRTCPSKFIVPYKQYMESTKIKYSIGMRFKMSFKGDEPSEKRFQE